MEHPLTKEFPLISIITPSLNQGRYIEDNIRSVLNQNYPNFEHIIIDGGSTDGTIDVLKSYDHLIWISEKDRGQSEAINKGLKRASGELIGWLNSDDCYEPNTFFTVIEELNRAEGKYVVLGDCNVIDERGQKIGYCKGNLTHPSNFIKYWEKNYTIPQPTVFFYRDILHKTGYLDINLHFALDYDFWLRISQHYDFHYVKKPLAKMRAHDHSKTSLGYEMFEREWFKILKKNWRDLSSVNCLKYFLLALSFKSNLARISAYAKMEDLSVKEFRKRIMLSIVANPLNIFRRKFIAAFLRAIFGHQNSNRIKGFLTKI